MNKTATPFTVMVDDNYHYMDEDERYKHGDFATAEEALAAARNIVDGFLDTAYEPGMSGSALYASYTAFGDDPFIVSSSGLEDVKFSAWDYARVRSDEICLKGK